MSFWLLFEIPCLFTIIFMHLHCYAIMIHVVRLCTTLSHRSILYGLSDASSAYSVNGATSHCSHSRTYCIAKCDMSRVRELSRSCIYIHHITCATTRGASECAAVCRFISGVCAHKPPASVRLRCANECLHVYENIFRMRGRMY